MISNNEFVDSMDNTTVEDATDVDKVSNDGGGVANDYRWAIFSVMQNMKSFGHYWLSSRSNKVSQWKMKLWNLNKQNDLHVWWCSGGHQAAFSVHDEQLHCDEWESLGIFLRMSVTDKCDNIALA